jgi:hypothetical protein
MGRTGGRQTPTHGSPPRSSSAAGGGYAALCLLAATMRVHPAVCRAVPDVGPLGAQVGVALDATHPRQRLEPGAAFHPADLVAERAPRVEIAVRDGGNTGSADTSTGRGLGAASLATQLDFARLEGFIGEVAISRACVGM